MARMLRLRDRRLRLTIGSPQPLRRAHKIPVWVDVLARFTLVVLLIGLAVLLHWLDREGLQDTHDGEVSFLDVFYFTMISVTTTGFGDIIPVSDRSRLIEAVIVTPIRMAVLLIFVGTAYSFIIKRTWEQWRMAHIQRTLTGHIVVLGFGVSGAESVKELIARGTEPRTIVVVDSSPERIKAAERIGCNVLVGDASQDQILHAVRIANAKSVLVSAGRDDSSILIVLTVRHLAPKVPINVVVRSQDNEVIAQQAGATNVINPVSFTGLLLAGSAQGTHIADYMVDLASVVGKVQIKERPVADDEIGKSIDELSSGGRGLRIYRGGHPIGFWEQAAQKLQAGDNIVEITRSDRALKREKAREAHSNGNGKSNGNDKSNSNGNGKSNADTKASGKSDRKADRRGARRVGAGKVGAGNAGLAKERTRR